MTTTFRGRSAARFVHAFVAVALFALLAPTAGLLADSQLAGWTPDHGHAGRVSSITTHTHPYDDHHAVGADGQPAEQAASEMTFTLADAVGGAASLVLAHEPASLPAPAPAVLGAPLTAALLVEGATTLVPTPPPRA